METFQPHDVESFKDRRGRVHEVYNMHNLDAFHMARSSMTRSSSITGKRVEGTILQVNNASETSISEKQEC